MSNNNNEIPGQQMNHKLSRRLQVLGILVATSILWSGNAHAQDQPLQSKPLPQEVAAEFDRRLTEIALQNVDIGQLEERIDSSEGLIEEILELRRDQLWTVMFRNTLVLARNVADRRDDGQDVTNYENLIIGRLLELPTAAIVATQRVKSRIIFPTTDAPPREFVISDQQLFRQIERIDDLYGALIEYLQIASRFNLDDTAASNFLTVSLTDAAANRSVFLEKTINDVATLRAAVATLPDNTELAEWSNAVETRIRMIAGAMQQIITLMNALDLDTRRYRQQILLVTGELTTDVLDVGILANLVKEWSTAAAGLVASEGPKLLFRLLLVALILFLFFQFAKLVQKGVERGIDASRLHLSHLLRRMILSTVRNLVVLLGVLIAISQLGISLGPLLAGLGIAGFIIGFALQDTLSNFASGIMILLYRPFDVGDVVEAGGVSGKVSHMSLVNTTFMTFDNQKLVVPNKSIWGSVITNVTAQGERRVDLKFGISYGDDIEKAEKVLREIVNAHQAVLQDPEPTIRLHELGESSVNFIVRPWVKTEDYWNTYWDITKAVKQRFDEEGISIPFPQRDVHVVEQRQAL